MSHPDNLTQKILSLFSEKLQIEVPDVNSDLIDEGLLDSLVFVDLLMHLESEFHIEILMDDLEIDQFRTVTRIAAYIDCLSTSKVAASSA